MVWKKKDYLKHGQKLLDELEPKTAAEVFTMGLQLEEGPCECKGWCDCDTVEELDQQLYSYRSVAYDFSRNYPAAIADATKLFDYFPEEVEIIQHTEQSLEELKEAFIQQAVETGISRDDVDLDWFYDLDYVGYNYHWRAYLHFQNGEYAEAIADLDIYLKLQPDNFDNYWTRCRAKFALKDKAGSISDAKRILELIDNHSPCAEIAREWLQEAESWPE